MLMVFTMNMCFDVHVKAWSLHLMLMAAVLIAPDLRRLMDVVLLNRTAAPRREPPLCRGRLLKWLPHAVVLLFGISMIVRSAGEVRQRAAQLYPPQPPLFGLWSVDEMAVDGRIIPPNTDPRRWRLVTFRAPGAIQVESDIGAKKKYPARVDPRSGTIALPNGNLHFAASGESVMLDGLLDGHPTRARLTRMPLVSQPWRWIYVFGPDD
jgi:hypothetical protein